MNKCEIETCNERTDGYLCEPHKKLAESKNAKFKICERCNTIIEVRVRDSEEDKYTFVKECKTCNFK